MTSPRISRWTPMTSHIAATLPAIPQPRDSRDIPQGSDTPDHPTTLRQVDIPQTKLPCTVWSSRERETPGTSHGIVG